MNALLLKWGAAAAAIATIIGTWTMVGLPIPAFSEDIRRLDLQQAEIAIEVYRKAIRDGVLLSRTVGEDDLVQRIIEQDLSEARENLKRAQDRKIELSK